MAEINNIDAIASSYGRVFKFYFLSGELNSDIIDFYALDEEEVKEEKEAKEEKEEKVEKVEKEQKVDKSLIELEEVKATVQAQKDVAKLIKENPMYADWADEIADIMQSWYAYIKEIKTQLGI